MDAEKFNQKDISNIIRNILTLRYIPQQETQLPILNYNDFVPSSTYNLELIENILKNSIISSTNDTKNISISLSGGVDSTLVLGLLRNTLPDIPIHAISIKFAESTDETNNAKKIADFFEAEHETLFLENYLLELPAAIGIIGLPFWDIHWYYMAKYAKTKSSFLASGDGGDELFAGYTFRYSKFLSMVETRSDSAKKINSYLSCHERDWVPDQSDIFQSKTEFSWNKIHTRFQPFFENSLSLLNQVFLADYNGKLLYNFSIIAHKINHFFNLKSIAPIIDKKLISYATHLPPESKYDVKHNVGKIPLRKLLSKYNCDSLISKEKLGFSVNTKNLWTSIGKDLCNSYFDDARIVEDGWIQKKWIDEHISNPDLDIRYINKFLGILALEIWYRIFITKEMNENTKLS